MATFTRLRRHHAGLRRHHNLRYLSRRLFHGRLQYRSNQRLDQLRMFEYYFEVGRIERWTKTVCKAICPLVFCACILHFLTPKARIYLSFYNLLFRSAVWLCVISITFLASLLCILFHQKERIQRTINRTWNRINRRLNWRHPSRTINNRPSRNPADIILTREEPSFTSTTKLSQVEEFLNIIARDFADDGLSSTSLAETSTANLRTANATEVDNNNQSPGDIDEGEQTLISLRISDPTLFESNNSVAERDIVDTSGCRVSFVDFIKLLKKFNRQSGQKMHSSSLNEIVLKYKEELLEKVKLSDDYQRITCVKDFYKFIQRNWDEWFLQNVSSNMTSEE